MINALCAAPQSILKLPNRATQYRFLKIFVGMCQMTTMMIQPWYTAVITSHILLLLWLLDE